MKTKSTLLRSVPNCSAFLANTSLAPVSSRTLCRSVSSRTDRPCSVHRRPSLLRLSDNTVHLTVCRVCSHPAEPMQASLCSPLIAPFMSQYSSLYLPSNSDSFLHYLIKFMNAGRSSRSGAGLPSAWIFFSRKAMLVASVRIVCIPSASSFTSPDPSRSAK